MAHLAIRTLFERYFSASLQEGCRNIIGSMYNSAIGYHLLAI
jgi:hypothetical protein